MRHSPYPSIVRLGPRPHDESTKGPGPIVGPHPNKSHRPYPDAKVAEVGRLVEQTTLTYIQIQEKSGIGAGLACRWARIHGWQTPPFAARSTDNVPHERASARLRQRRLGFRISALAERAVRELEASANVDLDRLAEAIELLKMAKLAVGHRPRRALVAPANEDEQTPQLFDAEPREVLRALRAAGIDTQRAREQALVDFMISRTSAPQRNLTRRERMTIILNRFSNKSWEVANLLSNP